MNIKCNLFKNVEAKISFQVLNLAAIFLIISLFFFAIEFVFLNLFDSFNALINSFSEIILEIADIFFKSIVQINTFIPFSLIGAFVLGTFILILYLSLVLVVIGTNFLSYIFFIYSLSLIAFSFKQKYRIISFFVFSFLLYLIISSISGNYRNIDIYFGNSSGYIALISLVIGIIIFIYNFIFIGDPSIGQKWSNYFEKHSFKRKNIDIDTPRLELASIFGICFIIFYYLNYCIYVIALRSVNSFGNLGRMHPYIIFDIINITPGTTISSIIGLIYLFGWPAVSFVSCFFLIYTLGLISASFKGTIRRLLFLFSSSTLFAMFLLNAIETKLNPVDIPTMFMLLMYILVFILNSLLNKLYLIGEIRGYVEGSSDTKLNWYIKGFKHMYLMMIKFFKSQLEIDYLSELLSYFSKGNCYEQIDRSIEENKIFAVPTCAKSERRLLGSFLMAAGIVLGLYIMLENYETFYSSINKDFRFILYIFFSAFLIFLGSKFIKNKKQLIPVQIYLLLVIVGISNAFISHALSNGNTLGFVIEGWNNPYFTYLFLLISFILYNWITGYIYYNKYISFLILLLVTVNIIFFNMNNKVIYQFDLVKIWYLLISFGLAGYNAGWGYSLIKKQTQRSYTIILILIIFIFGLFMGSDFIYVLGLICLIWSYLLAACLLPSKPRQN